MKIFYETPIVEVIAFDPQDAVVNLASSSNDNVAVDY